MANPITQIIITAVDRTRAAFASARSGIASLGAGAAALGSQLGLIFTGLSVAAFVGSIKRAIDAMDGAYNSAQKIGTSVENFSALGYAAKQSNLPVEDLEKSLIKLARGIDAAKEGSGPAAEAFKRLGIDPKQFNDPADALLVIADRFAKLPNGVEKAALAVDLFGRSGANMIPFLNEGSVGIKRSTDEAEKFGVVVKDAAGAAADQFNDSLDKLSAAGAGLGITIANDMLPGLNEMTRVMAEAAKQGGITSAIFAALKLGGTDFLSNTDLSGTYRLAEAQKQLNDLRKDGFDEDSHRIEQLNQWIPKLQALAAAEKTVDESRRKSSEDTTEALVENRKEETDAFKKSVNEQISDAARLQSALQDAFSESIKAEGDHLKEAKKLRAEANGKTAVDDDPAVQSFARMAALIAATDLHRISATASLETVQDQAEALRVLAEQIVDTTLKSDLLKQANLAEAAAREKASAAEADRSKGLAEQLRLNEARTDAAQAALEGIGKEVVVEVKPSAQTDATLAKLREIDALITRIKNTPVNLNVSASGGDSTADALSKAALQFGRR